MPVFELRPGPVVVGVDGSEPSLGALKWAYREAVRAGTPLEVVTAWPGSSRGGGPIPTAEQARTLAAHAITAVLPPEPRAVTVHVPSVPGRPDIVLIERGLKAGLVVVGPHGSHTLTEHLLGSVAEHVLAGASCPVAVVNSHAYTGAPVQHIVVGVDGSSASLAALRWAARYGVSVDAKVDALFAWDWRPQYGVYPYGPDEERQARQAQALLARSLVGMPAAMRAMVRTEVVHGHAADVLLRAGDAAQLIVVGDRRGGALASRLLGSVSRKVALHARVPVVVTHAPHVIA